ncbi:MAG: hypothetical protein DRJ42_04195 [Deltaproteobacteria bacterium]|nr:MAG: hypothetical protein DRJ42_04195 [Deltaproteobacteria bacterium]
MSKEVSYLPRILDARIERRLKSSGAVVIEGPRGCGKTWTGSHHAKTIVRVDSVSAQRMAATNLGLLLRGEPPVLLDEWQTAPELWNAVRHEVDDRQAKGLFILTGSARPADDARRHSGAGRMAKARMRPLSSWEAQRSTGEVSLAELLSARPVEGQSKTPFVEYAALVVRGGWPALLDASIDEAIAFSEDYVSLIVEHDAATLDGAQRNPDRLRRFLEAYAALSAHPVPMTRIVARATASADATLARATADNYAVAVERLMVTDDVRAWSTHMRSRARLTRVPKRHLADPSLACALMRATPERLLDDLESFGYLFESLVTRDLRVYAEANDADVYHYREHGGELEVDLIVEARDGAWIGVEVKLGEGYIDDAARNLRLLADTRIKRPPAALMVITTGEYAYTREDGVSVVPLAALRP